MGRSFVLGEGLWNQIIEDFVVAVHRRHLDVEEVVEIAARIYAIATREDWIDEIADDVEALKRNLSPGWEKRFWEASTRARLAAQSGNANGAARALRNVVREIAINSKWYPLSLFDYDDIVSLETLKQYFMDRDRLADRNPKLSDARQGEARGYALRIYDHLDRTGAARARETEPLLEALVKKGNS